MSGNRINAADAERVIVAVVTAFYMRHPDVERAVASDGVLYGALSKETEDMMWAAIQADCVTERLPNNSETL